MREQLEKHIEELSILTAMLHQHDAPGFQMTLEVCGAILQLIEERAEHTRLKEACRRVMEIGAAGDQTALFKELNDFAAAAQAYLRDPSAACFPGEETAAKEGWGEDLAPDFDAELLTEFISQHTSALEDFESDLLQAVTAASRGEAPEGIDQAVKGYLHNVKGEAATVGLKGVSAVTHRLEDLVVEKGAPALVDQLLAYKEWLLACLQACRQNKAPAVLASEFIARLEGTAAAQTGANEPRPSGTNAAAPGAATPQSEAPYPLAGEMEVLAEFITEAEDHLNGVEEALLERRGGCNTDDVAAFFRAIHSVKGGSAYFGLKEITASSHITETLLDEVRNGRLPFSDGLAELLLSYLDLQKLLFGAAREAVKSQGLVLPCDKTRAYIERLQAEYPEVDFSGKGGKRPPAAAGTVETKAPAPAAPAPSAATASSAAAASAATAPSSTAADESKPRGEKLDVKTFLKVEAGRLDQLIDYVGELVISSSMLTANCRRLLKENEAIMKNSHQVEQILREVQYIAMSMRLIPVKGVFQKMARLVWDLGKKIGKSVIFKMEGEDTELDRTVIDRISDPLMHMVRNSLDHGLEPPEERARAGKPREGLIKLKAYHKAGTVHIQIIDDGRGLDAEKIRAKALEKGLITAEQSLSKAELWQLIFAPGFSTAAVVTDVSGRGVGMDVVKRNIQSMRGRVLIDSEPGKGSTFTIELPLTLAIMDGIETAVGPERFIVPTLSIVEFLKPTPEMVSYALDRGETLAFRGSFLPIFRLSRLFQIEPRFERPEDAIMVVVEGAGERTAIMVDEVVGKHSTVIKSLGSMFAGARGLAGCAIMPDGYVGLILDVPSLVALARSGANGAPVKLPDHAARAEMLNSRPEAV